MRNNYDGMRSFHTQKLNDGKADVAIEVKLPKAKVEDCSGDGRDVHRYKGDVNLKGSDVKDLKVHVVGDDGKVQTFKR